ncbi:MAG: dephospho-CoA kinase, partial [Chlamydiae bacterium]|nr:dephospho-CoA kinase [Chlamydiota bacterium]
AKKVFSHAEALSSLEHILHPLVLDEMESRYTAIKDFQSYWLFVVEVPLLYETNSHTLFDVVVTVTAPKRLRQERCNKKEHALSWLQERNRRQLSQEEKAARAHYVLENNGTLGELQHKVLELINILQSP